MGIMEDLVDDDAVCRVILERKRIHVALAQARMNAGGLELHPREAKHFRGAVDADRLSGAGTEQFDHPTRASADVNEPAKHLSGKSTVDRALDFAFGDVEGSYLVPDLGVVCEIAVRSLGPLRAD